MKNIKTLFVASALVAAISTGISLASDDNMTSQGHAFTKQQAIEMALTEYPGEVIKAYMEKKRGKDVWEVKIKAEDGKKWELYYDAETGELVKSEYDD